MDGERGTVEIKDNKTDEVLWHHTWTERVRSETCSISLDNLKKDSGYVVCFTGTKIYRALVKITFASPLVRERVKPLR